MTPVAVLAAGGDCTTLGLPKLASCPVYAVTLSNRAAGPRPYSAAEVFAMAVYGPQLGLIAVYPSLTRSMAGFDCMLLAMQG